MNLSTYSYELVKFGNSFPEAANEEKTGIIQSPDVAPGSTGSLVLTLPGDWRDYDALYVTATDQYGRHINTWSWNFTRPSDFAARIINSGEFKVQAIETTDNIIVTSGQTEITFNKNSGAISDLKNNGKSISFRAADLFTGSKRIFKEMKHYSKDDNYIIESKYDSSTYATWTILKGGWLKLDYGYNLKGSYDFAGITFSYPEELVTSAILAANGPYHVWKNRLKGTQFGIFNKKYNNTVTGQSWDYPEFKGYYSNFYAAEVQTIELPLKIVCGTDDLFLHLFTPAIATNLKGVRGEVSPVFPEGNLSIMNGIPAIGTKFSTAEDEGPQGYKNHYDGMLKGTVYLKFGD